ncbi:MAG: hypothetical protein FJ271_04955 [Planctomycetes bacterium]|nr:hypothetical protein [Planctomycetota bacterium]
MDRDWKRFTDFLVEQGIDKVAHTTKTYLGHLIGLYRLMEAKGCNEELCRAGMFHSIYGTQQFQGFKLPLERRPEVRSLIGTRAEKLAYLNCAMQRETFDAIVCSDREPYVFTDRLTGEAVHLSRQDFDDLCRIHLYDWLEQVPRSQKWDYRRAAYRSMAERLGPPARDLYDEVFAAQMTPSSAG